MSDFKVKFRGVRGSFPTANREFMDYGGNTACVEVNVGGHLIILDAGTGIVSLGDDLLQKYIMSSVEKAGRTPISANVFLSHIHLDHLLGLPFFKPLHIDNSKINVFGSGSSKNSTLANDLSTLVFGKSFPLNLEDLACNFKIEDLSGFCAVVINKDGSYDILSSEEDINAETESEAVVISFYKSFVHPQDGVVIYKISYQGKSVVYASDKECYFGGDKKFAKFAKNCNLLIHDSQYTTEDYLNPNSPKQGFGHSTFDMAVETFKQTNAKKIAFFHYDPKYKDEKLDRIKELYTSANNNIIMSYEGLELEI